MKNGKIVYDPLYGFIRLTETEYKIIQSPYYSRLRWIKQLGFSNYIFPGAEHNRYAHAMGVMHMADQIIRAIGKAVPDEKLFDINALDEDTLFHKSIRISALLHDIGTFPFSDTCEAPISSMEIAPIKLPIAASHCRITTNIWAHLF